MFPTQLRGQKYEPDILELLQPRQTGPIVQLEQVIMTTWGNIAWLWETFVVKRYGAQVAGWIFWFMIFGSDHYAVRDACRITAFENNMLGPTKFSLKGVSQ